MTKPRTPAQLLAATYNAPPLPPGFGSAIRSIDPRPKQEPKPEPVVHTGTRSQIVLAFLRGLVASGEPLPHAAELARQCGLSEQMGRRTMHSLEERGLVTVWRGQGRGNLPAPWRITLVSGDVLEGGL